MSISKSFHLSMALSELCDVVPLLQRIASGELKPNTQEFNDEMLAYLTERSFDTKSCKTFVPLLQQELG